MLDKKDLLKTIYNATISINDNVKIPMDTNVKSIKVNANTIHLDSKGEKFEYILNGNGDKTNKYKFNIIVYKIPYKFLGFTINKFRRFITTIEVREVRYGYGSPSYYFTEDISYDSNIEQIELQEKIFNYLVNRFDEQQKKDVSLKIEKYIDDLNVLVDKSVSREDTLEKILNEK